MVECWPANKKITLENMGDYMKILLVGGGGREHAIAWKLSQSKKLKQLYIAPGNPGTAEVGTNVGIADNDIDSLTAFAKEKRIHLLAGAPQ